MAEFGDGPENGEEKKVSLEFLPPPEKWERLRKIRRQKYQEMMAAYRRGDSGEFERLRAELANFIVETGIPEAELEEEAAAEMAKLLLGSDKEAVDVKIREKTNGSAEKTADSEEENSLTPEGSDLSDKEREES